VHICRHLALSTNNIDKISSLAGMDQLKILSLGRNVIKKIENIEAVADTLEELWLSYNQIEKLVSCRITTTTPSLAAGAAAAAMYQQQYSL
jgi:Leucine-rich repeat (LRR) protein